MSGDSSLLGKALARVRPIDASTRLTRTSTYDLNAFDPDLSYMLGLGGLDNFLVQEGDTARGVSELRVATIATGADLPYGITFTLSHAMTRTTRLQRVGDAFATTETKQTEWPVGNVRWSRTFRGGPFTLLALGTAFRRREGSSVQAQQRRPSRPHQHHVVVGLAGPAARAAERRQHDARVDVAQPGQPVERQRNGS